MEASNGPIEEPKDEIQVSVENLRQQLTAKGSPVFENLAFEGGGAKGFFYSGVARLLGDVGLLPRLRRFAGTSIGAVTAMTLAIGGTHKDLDQIILSYNLADLIYDSTLGKLAILPNMVRKFGWNPAEKLLAVVKEKLKELTGNPDLTFMQLYRMRGIELCIVAANVSTKSPEYFHPKTTPDMSIALAVRSSVSLPGVMQPVKITKRASTEYLVDGGIVCNFPLHCFDGWYLSMKKEDSFFHRLGSKDPPFGSFNDKTLGVRLFSAADSSLIAEAIEKGMFVKPVRPKTKLSKSRTKACDAAIERELQRHKIYEAGNRFVKALQEADLDRDGQISVEEYTQAFVKNRALSEEDAKILFGDNFTMEGSFRELDTDLSGRVTADEFLAFMQKKGVAYQALMVRGASPIPLHDLGGFLSGAFNTVLDWTGQVYNKSEDAERTVRVFTDYVGTTDFVMEKADKAYCSQVGYTTMLRWLEQKMRKLNS